MNHSSPVTLRKVAPDANMHRQYTVTVTVDLFGTPLVICRWGRIGTAGQTREHVCATIEDAKEMAARLLEAKEQRGYGQGKPQPLPGRRAFESPLQNFAVKPQDRVSFGFPASMPCLQSQRRPSRGSLEPNHSNGCYRNTRKTLPP